MSTVAPHIFRAGRSTELRAFLCLGGSAVLIFLILVGFALLFFWPAGHLHLAAALGALLLLPLALVVRGIILLRSVTVVRVEVNAVTLEGFFSRRTIPWQRIRALSEGRRRTLLLVPVQVLKLQDEAGKSLAVLPGSFEDFTGLVEAIKTARDAQLEARQATARV